MTRVNTLMPAPDSAIAGNTATVKFPIGRRYHALHLIATATAIAPSDLTEIRVMLNNTPVQRFSGAERNALNMHDGLADAAINAGSFILRIPFDRIGLLNRMLEEETAINTGSPDADGIAINQFSLEIDLKSTITGTINLSINAEQSEKLPGGPGTIPYILRNTKDIATVGEHELADMPKGTLASVALERVFFIASANNITRGKIQINELTVFDRTSALNNRILSDGIRVPQASYFAIDRTEWGYGADPIGLQKGIEDFRYKLTVDGAMSLVILSHYWGRVPR